MFYFVLCSVIWGFTWIAIEYQFHSVDSGAAVFYRFAMASLILFAIAKFKNLPLKFNKEIHLIFAAQGFFMFCLNYQITYFATQMAPSALIALGFTSLTYFNLFAGKIFFKIPIERKVLIGACLSFLGMIFISYNELLGQSLHPTSLLGFVLSLVATASASMGNLISAQSRKRKIPITSNNAWGMLYGSCFTLIYCMAAQKPFVIQNVDRAFLLSFLYLCVFGTVISFGAYIKLIDIMGPGKAAFTSIVSPVIAVMASMAFENLTLTWLLAGGIVFCLIGNLVALLPQDLVKKTYAH